MSAASFPSREPVLTPIRQMYLAMFFVAISVSVLTATFPPFVRSAGHDVATVGFLVSVFSVLSLASRLPVGALCTGRRASVFAVGATALLALTTAAYALPGNLFTLLAVRAANGFAYGVVTTVNMALLMEAIDRPERRAGVTGWYLGWIAAGHAVGGYLGGFLVDTLGYQVAYLLVALVVLTALPFTAARRATGLREASDRPRGAPPERHWQFLLSLRLLVPALQAFSINALSQIIWAFYPLYGLDVGLTLSMLGLHHGSYATTSMVVRPFVGQLAAWLSYRQLATWGLVATAALTMLVPLFTAFFPLLLLSVVLGGLRAVALVASMVAAVEYAGSDARKRGMAAGVYSFSVDGALVVAPLLGGLVAERTGLVATFWAMPVLLMAVYFVLLAASGVVARRGR